MLQQHDQKRRSRISTMGDERPHGILHHLRVAQPTHRLRRVYLQVVGTYMIDGWMLHDVLATRRTVPKVRRQMLRISNDLDGPRSDASMPTCHLSPTQLIVLLFTCPRWLSELQSPTLVRAVLHGDGGGGGGGGWMHKIPKERKLLVVTPFRRPAGGPGAWGQVCAKRHHYFTVSSLLSGLYTHCPPTLL